MINGGKLEEMSGLSSVAAELLTWKVPPATMWTTENTVAFIESLQSTPCLWDVTSSDYKHRGKKKDAVTKLAEQYNVTVLEIEKKISVARSAPSILAKCVAETS